LSDSRIRRDESVPDLVALLHERDPLPGPAERTPTPCLRADGEYTAYCSRHNSPWPLNAVYCDARRIGS